LSLIYGHTGKIKSYMPKAELTRAI